MASKKPAPISRKLTKAPPKKKVEPVAQHATPQAFNAISPITAKQIAKAERSIKDLAGKVEKLQESPPPIHVKTQSPKIEVTMPARARIATVKIKYDPFGMPTELVPEYKEV